MSHLKISVQRFSLFALFSFIALPIWAQSGTSGSNYLAYMLGAAAVILLLSAIAMVSSNLIGIKAQEMGVDTDAGDMSIFPKSAGKKPAYANGSGITFLKKGYDILLEGGAATEVEPATATRFAVQPPNFVGISPIPKVTVEIGDEVKAGDVLFFDKKRPAIKYCAPVSGEVVAVNRGAKRSIAEVVILADKEQKYREYPTFDLANGSREDLVNYLLESGVWPMINQRPYDIVPEPEDEPKNIFVSTFDTAPLAPDNNLVVAGRETAFQKGLDVLGKLTSGKVYLGLDARGDHAPADAFTQATGVVKHWFKGAHPSGNVGVQIHHLDPINAGDKVWTMTVQEVITLGALFSEGRFNTERVVALTGAELKKPRYVRTYQGANLGDLLAGEPLHEKARIVSGDVLSGKQKTRDNFMDFRADQVTVLEEGDQYEMFGWLLPLKSRPSISRTFPNFMVPDLKFKANTNTHGEQRAFVVTGQYESMLPMDIMPQHLMKSIMMNDFERMEGLGIYELSEEDVALCEFACTSKQPLQALLREGLDTMREQG